MYVDGWLGVYVSTIKRKPPRNDLKLGTIVVLDTVSQPIDFDFRGTGLSFQTFGISCYIANKTDYSLLQKLR